MIPYLGCKQSFAKELLANIPEAENFYDLFGGGGSITEAASGCQDIGIFGKWQKWKHIHYNEINKGVYLLNKEIWSGAFDFERAKKTWISRERFHAEKGLPTAWGAMTRFCWSFGNDGRTYLYGEKIELAKQLMHTLTVADNPFFPKATQKEKRLIIKKAVRSLQSLERLESLESLESNATNLDYREVRIKPGSVAYCDIPYDTGRTHYGLDFDFAAFHEWAATRKFPVYFSEYGSEDKRFVCVWEKDVNLQIEQKRRQKHLQYGEAVLERSETQRQSRRRNSRKRQGGKK